MSVRYQLVVDCTDQDRMARFWASALGYQLAQPPAGYETWNDYYRTLGVPEKDLIDGADRISDPNGHGPDIWFQKVPDQKVVKNRLHVDVRASDRWTAPIETRKQQIDAEARRLAELGATIQDDLTEPLASGAKFYAVAMKDPEGNEFDIN